MSVVPNFGRVELSASEKSTRPRHSGPADPSTLGPTPSTRPPVEAPIDLKPLPRELTSRAALSHRASTLAPQARASPLAPQTQLSHMTDELPYHGNIIQIIPSPLPLPPRNNNIVIIPLLLFLAHSSRRTHLGRGWSQSGCPTKTDRDPTTEIADRLGRSVGAQAVFNPPNDGFSAAGADFEE